MLLGIGFVYASFLSGAGLEPFACVFVCLLMGGGLVGLRVLFRMAVCQSALARLGNVPLLWSVFWSCGGHVPQENVLGY